MDGRTCPGHFDAYIIITHIYVHFKFDIEWAIAFVVTYCFLKGTKRKKNTTEFLHGTPAAMYMVLLWYMVPYNIILYC